MLRYLFTFLLGGGLYVLLELLWRGRSHSSMFLAGGLCLTLLFALFSRYPLPLPFKCLVGGLLITAVEFLFGFAVNIRAKKGVWDYSHRPFHLYGQVCLEYSLLWTLLSLPIALLCAALSRYFL